MKTEPKLHVVFRELQVVDKAEDERAVQLPMKIRDAIDPERVVRFLASDDTVDRYRDVVLASGWDLTEFVRNPVLMAFHDYQTWPLGTAIAAGVIGNALYLDCEFDPPEVDEAADKVFRKIKRGTVKTGSVGFRAVEAVTADMASINPMVAELFKKYPTARRIFTKQQLLEFSICPLPANPNATAASLMARMKHFLGSEPLDAGADSEPVDEIPQGIEETAERIQRALDRMSGGA